MDVKGLSSGDGPLIQFGAGIDGGVLALSRG